MKKEKLIINWGNPQEVNAFKILIRSYYDYQRERISLSNRIGMKKSGEVKRRVPPRDPIIITELYKRLEEVQTMENALKKEVDSYVHSHPLWESFLKHVKGCGEVIAGVLLSEIDIHKADNISKIWSFAGLAPGKDRKEKGKKCPFNQFLKAKLCGVLGTSFLKSHSDYTKIYYDERKRLENSSKFVSEAKEGKAMKWEDTKPIHRHRASVRKMIKEFLKDLYVAWRTIEGLPVREPYQVEYLEKKHGRR